MAETINPEDYHYSQLRAELESDAQNLEAESWSVAMDPDYIKSLHKDSVKRQDVIYELMQTEMHTVRTLKILLYVFMYELKQSGLIDDARLKRLFPAVDALLSHHQHFLDHLKTRMEQSQEEEGSNNYQISQLGDILITQFSGSVGEGMKECYSVFCSHQSDAIKFYKEQLQNSKKFQQLIKKIGQLPLVRRRDMPHCFLLVTQRITKYPVLIERLIKNTEADTDEHKSLVHGLALIKDTISQVNEQVSEFERRLRLRDICVRLEPKSQGRVMDDKIFRREDLLQGTRSLLHEGSVVWKTPGRQKEIHVVLLSDVVLLLQEKDQKFVFAAMDKIPPVITLQGLIVREVALADSAMYLICACTSNMYELHTGSKNERDTWMSYIREAVNNYMEEEEPYSEEMSQLQQYQISMKECDEQLKQTLEWKQNISVSLFEAVTGQDCPHRGLTLRGETADLHQGETLLQDAINQVENLQSLLIMRVKKMQNEKLDISESRRNSTTKMNGDVPDPELHLADTFFAESLELSADGDDTVRPNCTLTPKNLPEEDTLLVCERMVLLSQKLNSLQVVLANHSSQMELLQACQMKSKRSGNSLLEQENHRNMEKQKEELAHLQKLQTQLREEQSRWERERDRQKGQMEALEAEVRQRQDQCRQREEKLSEERTQIETQRDEYQRDLERLRESIRTLDRDREQHKKEQDRLEKLKRQTSFIHPDIRQGLNSNQSFRSTISSGGNLTARPYIPNLPKSDPKEIPPKVPPRRESISPKPNQTNHPKPPVPIQLRSTTNDPSAGHKTHTVIQQQIPTKLASINPKNKTSRKKTHKRANSAANIDVSQVIPIRVSGKEGGSLRAQSSSSPHGIHNTTDLFTPPVSTQNVKPSPSFSSQRRKSDVQPPPLPPPFPKDPVPPKEKVIIL